MLSQPEERTSNTIKPNERIKKEPTKERNKEREKERKKEEQKNRKKYIKKQKRIKNKKSLTWTITFCDTKFIYRYLMYQFEFKSLV